jgi:hypothetical protein
MTILRGAQVVMLKNDKKDGFCDGTQAVVTKINVEAATDDRGTHKDIFTKCGAVKVASVEVTFITPAGLLKTATVLPVMFDAEVHGVRFGGRCQFSFALSYAMTVFKAQSLGLHNIIINLWGDFGDAHAYTALSRAKNSGGLLIVWREPKKSSRLTFRDAATLPADGPCRDAFLKDYLDPDNTSGLNKVNEDAVRWIMAHDGSFVSGIPGVSRSHVLAYVDVIQAMMAHSAGAAPARLVSGVRDGLAFAFHDMPLPSGGADKRGRVDRRRAAVVAAPGAAVPGPALPVAMAGIAAAVVAAPAAAFPFAALPVPAMVTADVMLVPVATIPAAVGQLLVPLPPAPALPTPAPGAPGHPALAGSPYPWVHPRRSPVRFPFLLL